VLSGPATHTMLFGGSRSGKTFLALRAIAVRALKAPGSRHAVLRHRFNAIVSSVVMDTWPRMLDMCYPGVPWEVNRSLWYAQAPNGSQVWFGGLDDKERVEKILGNEYATIFLNECSQIPWSSRNMALTRLAQRVTVDVEGMAPQQLKLRMLYDMNPPDRAHWSYRAFMEKRDPESREPLPNPSDFAAFQLNPQDNLDNLPDGYIDSLKGMSARMQRRFLFGEFRDANPNALFAQEHLDKWRVVDAPLPDMQRVVIAVDPSGAGDEDAVEHDAIGIVVAGLGTDGNAYVLEDLTLKAGPAAWGKVIATAFERHDADLVVAEINYGGAMVKHVVQAARPRTPFMEVRASRGKVVRAEPVSALVEEGKVRIVGYMTELEEELAGFSTLGYTGEGSPNRADAFVWAISQLFPRIAVPVKEKTPYVRRHVGSGGWMAR
jgi:predicted phage terminase large subunit-like protein